MDTREGVHELRSSGRSFTFHRAYPSRLYTPGGAWTEMARDAKIRQTKGFCASLVTSRRPSRNSYALFLTSLIHSRLGLPIVLMYLLVAGCSVPGMKKRLVRRMLNRTSQDLTKKKKLALRKRQWQLDNPHKKGHTRWKFEKQTQDESQECIVGISFESHTGGGVQLQKYTDTAQKINQNQY